jgi:putative nucleotidyltransferase with HDIG domain
MQAAGAWLRPVEVDGALLGHYLTPQAVHLFMAMPSQDRQHALNVFYSLQQEGYDDHDLLAAALLHDVGKGVTQRDEEVASVGQGVSHREGPRLWHRVAVVLILAFWPSLLEQLGQEERQGWRRPFYIQLHHPELGAELARQAGCSPVTVGIIRRHEDPPDQKDDPLLAALRAADGTN